MKIRNPVRFVVSVHMLLLLVALCFEKFNFIDVDGGHMTLANVRCWGVLREVVSFPVEEIVDIKVDTTIRQPIRVCKVRFLIVHRSGMRFVREWTTTPSRAESTRSDICDALSGHADFHFYFPDTGIGVLAIASLFAFLWFLSSITEVRIVKDERF